ncbi:MAG: hypothetical protein COY81_01455 [Candidatus Pacebacteria bacterium CG_4_10_14_0_8_um_filter_43_12]|nr:MAG: hypothetical protein COU66_02795 [Candidatus Pacebacteria bacterium CG10_big_fil_rev_8_21_14_0_10_44_11]PIY79659.1 MAG: hypothetical protein COY81_01455 [Candidatus Pacebacteria bacterium CG_4_10_14_0_8_um_filter_43_12]
MKKEVLIAILIGFGLGLTITYSIYRLRTAMEDKPQTIEEIVSTTPSPSADTQSMLAILTPADGSIQTEKTATVAGSTFANAFVVLFVNNTDYTQTSDESGNFSFEVKLDDGSNVLKAHVLNENGEVVTKESVVVVSDLYSAEPEASQSAAEGN